VSEPVERKTPDGDPETAPQQGRQRPAAGNALTPAALQRHLRSAVFGHRIFYYPTIDSTNARALALAAAGEPEGGLVLAEEQTEGRGRRERSWTSTAHLGIYASLILRPAIPAPRSPLLTLMAAVAVADALNEVHALGARIKWPNDVLVSGRKIAGVLGEVRGGDPEIREMVVGIGVNVNHASGDFPAAFAASATSVRLENGIPVDRAPILAAILEGFERRYARLLRDGPVTLLREWTSLATPAIGTRLSVEAPSGRVEGSFSGIDEEGALVLDGPGGRRHRIAFGEIVEPMPR